VYSITAVCSSRGQTGCSRIWTALSWKISEGHFHATSSSSASLLRRVPRHTLLSSLIRYSRYFSSAIYPSHYNWYVGLLCFVLYY